MSTRQTTSGTFRPIGQIAAEVVSDLQRRRKVQHLHRLRQTLDDDPALPWDKAINRIASNDKDDDEEDDKDDDEDDE